MPSLRSPQRDLRIDTLTGILICLVVFGHLIEEVPGHAADTAYTWVYLFHMPAFAMVSGFVTRYARRLSVPRLAATLLFPYAVLMALHYPIQGYWLGDTPKWSLLQPKWTLWYLLALFAWRCTTPVIRRLRLWALPLSVAVGLGAGLVPFADYTLAMGRIASFLPFFVLGVVWRDSWTAAVAARWRLATVALGLAAVWVAIAGYTTPRAQIHMALPYNEIGLSAVSGVMHRAVVYGIATALVLALWSVARGSIRTLASIGVASLTVYVLHPLALYAVRIHGMPDGVAGPAVVAGFAVLAFAVSWLLSRSIVGRATAPLVDGNWWSTRWRAGRIADPLPETAAPDLVPSGASQIR